MSHHLYLIIMVSASEALSVIGKSLSPIGTTTLSADSALGYFLAEDIRSEEDVPPFHNAAMDGFAVRAEDCTSVPATLRLAGEISAGQQSGNALQRGEAIAISTGAPIPAGCTAVVQKEWTAAGSAGEITITRPIKSGQNIRSAGADISAGSVALHPGIRIRAQEIGVLVSLGRLFVSVYRKPRVAILATGSELVEPDKPLPRGMVRNSNAHVLMALARQAGCEARYCGIARDDRDDLRQKLNDALQSDLVITSGGISVGKHDLVQEILRDLGVNILFWKVNIKPGMPMLFGMRDKTPVFALPGNPVSSMVTFLQFVSPAIERLSGNANPGERMRWTATLAEDLMTTDGKLQFVRGVLEGSATGLVVRSTGSQISNILTSLTKANCLIILPENKNHFPAGTNVEVELLQ